MDEETEDELLMHIAAGTDLPTAMAALPRSNNGHDDLQSSTPTKSVQASALVIIAVVAIIVLWIMSR